MLLEECPAVSFRLGRSRLACNLSEVFTVRHLGMRGEVQGLPFMNLGFVNEQAEWKTSLESQ